jgi:DNA helicase-2/ATP-dependent DNA helicase PcrA
MPYRVYGGMRFFERAEVKNALAYLRLLASSEDDGALLRVVNFPPRGIGARSLENLQGEAQSRGVSLWQAACSKPAGGRSGAAIAAFVQQVERLRSASAGLALPELIEHVLHDSGLLAHYRAEKDGQERVENLEELVNAAGAFVREMELAGGPPAVEGGPAPDGIAAAVQPGAPGGVPVDAMLTAFLAHAALEAGDTQAAEGRPALQLMTVHSAKGLEFHTVFVTGLEEGLFPHENSLAEADGVEEERRLMYVAITRARRRLYLTHAQSRMLHGQFRYNVSSRFFDEIPASLLHWLSSRPANLAAADFADEAPAWRGDGYRRGPAPVSPPAVNRTAVTNPDVAGAGLRIGQSVQHAKFGVGIIVDAKGHGPDIQVQVNFRDVGPKWLALEYARLTPA